MTYKSSLLTLIATFFCLSLVAQYKHDSIQLTKGYLHYYTKGEGKPIVFFQGGPGFSSYYCRAIADSLIGYKCILIDFEGTGRSQYRKADTSWVSANKIAADAELVRKKLNISQWIILGHSYGTHFALNYATKNTLVTSKVILISSIGTNNKFQQYANDNASVRLTDKDMEDLDSIFKDTLLNELDREFASLSIILKSYFYDKKKVKPFLESLPNEEKSINFSNNFFNAYVDNASFNTWDISKQVYALKLPIYIIQGRQDFLNDGTQEVMNLKLHQSKINYIEKSGHFPWFEKPIEFHAVLRKVLSSSTNTKK